MNIKEFYSFINVSSLRLLFSFISVAMLIQFLCVENVEKPFITFIYGNEEFLYYNLINLKTISS